MSRRVVKLMTPPTAPAPYVADAPSLRTSTVWSASVGMVLMSAPKPPLVEAMRRPLNSTSEPLEPWPRMSTLEKPDPVITSGLDWPKPRPDEATTERLRTESDAEGEP